MGKKIEPIAFIVGEQSTSMSAAVARMHAKRDKIVGYELGAMIVGELDTDALEAEADRLHAAELREAIADRLEAAPERSSQEGLLAAIAASERPGMPSNVSTWMVGATYRNFRHKLFVVTKVEQISELGWEISYKASPAGTAIRKMDFAKWLTIMTLVGLAA